MVYKIIQNNKQKIKNIIIKIKKTIQNNKEKIKKIIQNNK